MLHKPFWKYIMTLADSSYEDWQRAHEDQTFLDFQFSLEKMNVSGALFDFVKLQNINNGYLSKLSTVELYEQGLAWAKDYHQELAKLMEKHADYTKAALNIEKAHGKRPEEVYSL